MAQLFHIHPEHPQPRLIKQAAVWAVLPISCAHPDGPVASSADLETALDATRPVARQSNDRIHQPQHWWYHPWR